MLAFLESLMRKLSHESVWPRVTYHASTIQRGGKTITVTEVLLEVPLTEIIDVAVSEADPNEPIIMSATDVIDEADVRSLRFYYWGDVCTGACT